MGIKFELRLLRLRELTFWADLGTCTSRRSYVEGLGDVFCVTTFACQLGLSFFRRCPLEWKVVTLIWFCHILEKKIVYLFQGELKHWSLLGWNWLTLVDIMWFQINLLNTCLSWIIWYDVVNMKSHSSDLKTLWQIAERFLIFSFDWRSKYPPWEANDTAGKVTIIGESFNLNHGKLLVQHNLFSFWRWYRKKYFNLLTPYSTQDEVIVSTSRTKCNCFISRERAISCVLLWGLPRGAYFNLLRNVLLSIVRVPLSAVSFCWDSWKHVKVGMNAGIRSCNFRISCCALWRRTLQPFKSDAGSTSSLSIFLASFDWREIRAREEARANYWGFEESRGLVIDIVPECIYDWEVAGVARRFVL